MEKWNFCGKNDVEGPQGFASWFFDNVAAGPEGPGENTQKDRLTVAYIYQGSNGHAGRHGITFAGGGAVRSGIGNLTGGWLVPRLTWLRGKGANSGAADILYAPSASRAADWYGAMGYEGWGGPSPNQLVQEVGMKFRVTSSFLGLTPLNSLLGVRIGYRGQLFKDLAGGRFVFEVGLGGW